MYYVNVVLVRSGFYTITFVVQFKQVKGLLLIKPSKVISPVLLNLTEPSKAPSNLSDGLKLKVYEAPPS